MRRSAGYSKPPAAGPRREAAHSGILELPKPDKLALSDLNAEILVVVGFTWLLWSLLMLALGSLLW